MGWPSYIRAKKEADAIKYRRELIKLGLIDYKRGRRGEICEYRLLHDSDTDVSDSVSESAYEQGSKTVSKKNSTYKDKEIKKYKDNNYNYKIKKTSFSNFEQRDTTYADLDEAYFRELREEMAKNNE